MGLAAQASSILEGQLPAEAAGSDPREVARALIDTLGMLEEKSKGNLTEDEQKLLGEVLTGLRFRFVQGQSS